MSNQHQDAQRYTCPMHPEVVQDHPGKCPKCGMELVPKHEAGMDHGGEQDHEKMMRDMLAQWIWRDFANIILGLWLLTAPFTFGYRSAAMTWSDIISGAVIAVLGVMTLWPRFDLARWGICFAGIWLLFAPLVFWSPDPAAYANDTLAGALVIAFSVLIPMMPGMAHHMLMVTPGPQTPPGWSYNPSTWFQRGPIIALALVGFFISRYLATYQLGYVNHAWEPFFSGGEGTRKVLDSDVSKMWPISDAGLGAVAYLIEALSGFMGGRDRWRTMPWMVAMFGVLVIPLGIVSIVLIILQPLAVGAWCTLCLITAAAMVIMITPALDEVIAMLQFLIGARREGKPLWRTFWLGGTLDSYRASGGGEMKGLDRSPSVAMEIIKAMELDNVPWNLIAATALGVWLMFTPTALGVTGAAADSHHLVGALIVTCSVIAFGEAARSVRFLNVLMGLWITLSPWLLSGDTAGARWHDPIVGLLLVVLSLRRGRVKERYGGWDRWVV